MDSPDRRQDLEPIFRESDAFFRAKHDLVEGVES
jgi:hypothetical protein